MSKLEEKYHNQICETLNYRKDDIMAFSLVKQCAEITEQECIGFAEWIVKRWFIETGDNEYWSNHFTGRFTMYELFQIFQLYLKSKENE